jgi:CheY-like chemotaxis protein
VRVTVPEGVTLHTDLEALPGPVWADATQLHQVLMNLCTNALQALQGAPGTITVGLKSVELGTDAAHRPAGLGAGPHARLWVSDSGCGIDAFSVDRIFEPYFTTKGGGGGTGLGLSVVHGIVKAHHGSIAVESSLGRGSTFSVYLPLADASREPAAQADEAAGPASMRGTGQHILYLDDDDVMCVMIERLLARAGYRVSCQVDAVQALTTLRADPLAFDLVVTDFNMPGLSGLHVSRAVSEVRPDLPVILISGYVSDDLPAEARRAGVHEVVGKQNLLEDLLPAIARALAAVPVPLSSV